MIWEKFLCNVTLSAPCAAFDVTVGELMSEPDAWAVALGCMLEAHRVAVAQGVEFPFDDPIDYVTTFAATIPNASPSLRLDHLARRRSEIDVINGQVVALSRELGLDAPYNETLCALLRRRESTFEP
jgi:2-dehydropantoate 2-reductase